MTHAQPHRPQTLAQHAAAAQQALPASAWAYFQGGAADEHTLQANTAAWSEWQLLPRVLQPLTLPDTAVTLCGRRWPTPLLVAPMACQKLAHPDGECATALAAAALGCGMVLSTQSTTPLQDVGRHFLPDPDRGPLWFQLYHRGDRAWLLEQAQQAQAVGYEALVLTVDAPIQGVRDRERTAGFHLPPHMTQPHWLAGAAQSLAELVQQAPTWDDVAWLQSHSPLPLLLKGINHPLDAEHACQLQVAGVIVSNHGGRTLDTLPPTAHTLPNVVQAIQGRCHVLVDGGLRRGTDILKALALGAEAVLLGRPVIHGLGHSGAQGVAQVLRLLLDEFQAAMVLCGVTRIRDCSHALLHSPPAPHGWKP